MAVTTVAQSISLTVSSPESLVEEFRRSLNTEWRTIPDRNGQDPPDSWRSFYRTESIKRWMLSTDDGSLTRCERLLREVRPIRIGIISSDDIYTGDQTSILVFSILLALYRERLIYIFHSAGIRDHSLGDDSRQSRELKKLWRSQRARRQHPDLCDLGEILQNFETRKWEFYVVHLPIREHTEIPAHRPLPWCAIRQSNSGGQAQVMHVAINSEFISEDLQSRLGVGSFRLSTYGQCYEFAVKSFDERDGHEAWEAFNRERQFFRALDECPHVLRSFSSYTILDQSENRTYYLLLEFANTDLGKYFDEKPPPQTAAAIFDQWSSICKVASAIREVNNLRIGSHVYPGVHGDVKPGNILLVQGMWKLADFGFAEWRVDTESDRRGSRISMEGGTATYGAPGENILVSGQRTDVSPTFDTWSFGCLLLVTATWVVLGAHGVHQFTKVRQDACARGGDQSDTFHNGTCILPEVKEWICLLKDWRRRTDEITPKFLDLVETHMLQNANSRLSMAKVCQKLDEILGLHGDLLSHREGQHQGSSQTPSDQILESLARADENREDQQVDQIDNRTGRSQILLGSSDYHRAILVRDRSRTPKYQDMSRLPLPSSSDLKTNLPYPPLDRSSSPVSPCHGTPSGTPSITVIREGKEDKADHHPPSSRGDTEVSPPLSLDTAASVTLGFTIWHALEDKTALHKQVAREILENNPRAAGDVRDGKTPIMLATKRRNIEMMELLLPYVLRDSSVLHHTDSERKTLLHYFPKWVVSEDRRYMNMVTDCLRGSTALVNATDDTERSALWYGIEYNRVRTVKVLLENGAMLQDERFDYFREALDRESREIVEVMLNHGQGLNVRPYLDQRPRHIRILLERYLR